MSDEDNDIIFRQTATPAVGGLAEATIELNGLLDKYWMGDNSKTNIIAMCAAQQKCKDALATQPASQPAVGGEREAIATIIDPVAAYHIAAINTDGYKSAYEKADAILALNLPASPLREAEIWDNAFEYFKADADRAALAATPAEALADRFEAVCYRPDMFGDDDKIGGPSLTLAERDFIVGLLRAQQAPASLRGHEMDLKTSEEDETLMRATLLKCYSEGPYAFRVSKEHYLYLAEQIIALREGSRRMAAASPLRQRLVEQLTEWFDCLDFDRSHEATRQAEYSELMRIVASALPPEQPAADPTILAHCDELHDLGFAAGWDAAKEACASYLYSTTESKRFAVELMTAQSLQRPQKETK